VGTVASSSYSISVWSAVPWGAAILLLFVAARKLVAFHRWRSWMQDDVRRSLFVLLAWVVLHNLCYMLFLPVPGTASRYGARTMVLWALVWLRPGAISEIGAGVAGVLIAAAVQTPYWNGV
jgi:hypothetical protein